MSAARVGGLLQELLRRSEVRGDIVPGSHLADGGAHRTECRGRRMWSGRRGGGVSRRKDVPRKPA